MKTTGVPDSKSASPEDAILAVLRRSRTGVSIPELLARVKDQGVEDEPAIKAAIWRLIAEYKIEMTEERNLRVQGRAEGRMLT